MKKKGSATREAQSAKISQLVREGMPQRQAIAVSFSEFRKGGVKRLRESHGKKRAGAKRATHA